MRDNLGEHISVAVIENTPLSLCVPHCGCIKDTLEVAASTTQPWVNLRKKVHLQAQRAYLGKAEQVTTEVNITLKIVKIRTVLYYFVQLKLGTHFPRLSHKGK